MVEVELWRQPVLVTLLTQHVLPDPPPAVLPLDAAAARLLLLLVLALDILGHGAPPPLQSAGVVGCVARDAGDLKRRVTSSKVLRFKFYVN